MDFHALKLLQYAVCNALLEFSVRQNIINLKYLLFLFL